MPDVLVLPSLLALIVFGIAIAVFVALTPTKREKEKEDLKSDWTCPKCGRRDVPRGAEQYHERRCHGRRTQENYAFKGGGRIER